MRGQASRTPYCCGLYELGGFDNAYGKLDKSTIRRSRFAHISVTRRLDVKQKLWLRSVGFKKVGKWKNPNTGKVLTMWARFPEE